MEILQKVSTKELSPGEAFSLLYGDAGKKTRFFYLRIFVKDSIFISLLVNTIFLLPFPLFLVKPIIKKILKEEDLSPELYNRLVASGKGTKILIKTKDAKIKIKLI
ncbi:MAG: hypothetical protein ACOX43_07375 [Bacilli bacterium]|jgi:hypothetical protein